MLYVKYLTPKENRPKKYTCIILTTSGKINLQGCNDDD